MFSVHLDNFFKHIKDTFHNEGAFASEKEMLEYLNGEFQRRTKDLMAQASALESNNSQTVAVQRAGGAHATEIGCFFKAAL